MTNALNADLENLQARVKGLRKALRLETVDNVAKIALRNEAKDVGIIWHNELLPKLKSALLPEIADKYSKSFTRLIELSRPNNRKVSYLTALEEIIKGFDHDLIVPGQQGALVVASPNAGAFSNLFSTLGQADESDYLKEAVACAIAGHRRAAAVLGWSAAIDRIHRAVEHVGFKHFNLASSQMASQTTGRYKKFNQVQNVSSLSEMREVFDNIILWVIEGMGLVDANQHTRLKSCFDMRCQCAHPGDAPITDYNLASFFSDLEQIIFLNPKFKVS